MEPNINDAFRRHFPRLAEELGLGLTEFFLHEMSLLELPAHRKLMRYRMPVDSMYFIVQGTVVVTTDDGPSSKVLDVLGPGQCLGEVSALSGDQMASASVTTQSSARFLRLRHAVLEEFITTHQAIASVFLPHLVLMLSDRLRKSWKSQHSLVDSSLPTG
jgi:CRP-like cAMP-binding protein